MNMVNKFSRLIVLSSLALFAVGCATTQPYDYSAFNEAKPRSVLVIPPMNNTVEVDAPYVYLSTISRPLAEKGYYVFPVAVIDNFMKENGLPTPAEMNQVPLDKLRENTGADAVLYVELSQWGQKYQVFSSKAVVEAQMKLVDARTGTLLWDGTASAVQQSDSGGGGIIGALINALATQIASSISDPTVKLARTANAAVVNNAKRGLLDGPYKPVAVTQ